MNEENEMLNQYIQLFNTDRKTIQLVGLVENLLITILAIKQEFNNQEITGYIDKTMPMVVLSLKEIKQDDLKPFIRSARVSNRARGQIIHGINEASVIEHLLKQRLFFGLPKKEDHKNE